MALRELSLEPSRPPQPPTQCPLCLGLPGPFSLDAGHREREGTGSEGAGSTVQAAGHREDPGAPSQRGEEGPAGLWPHSLCAGRATNGWGSAGPRHCGPKACAAVRCCAVSGGRAPTGGSGTSGPRTVTLPGGRGTHVPALLLKTSCPPPCWQPLRATSAQQSLAVASWSWRPKCSHSRGSPDPRRHPWGSHGASVLALGALAPQLCGPGARAHAEACSGRVPWGAGGAIPHQGLPGRHATC